MYTLYVINNMGKCLLSKVLKWDTAFYILWSLSILVYSSFAFTYAKYIYRDCREREGEKMSINKVRWKTLILNLNNSTSFLSLNLCFTVNLQFILWIPLMSCHIHGILHSPESESRAGHGGTVDGWRADIWGKFLNVLPTWMWPLTLVANLRNKPTTPSL